MKRLFYVGYFHVLIYVVWIVRGDANPNDMINFIPFHTIQLYITAFIHGYAPKYVIIGNLIGNIILFIPFGILLVTYIRQIGVFTLIFLSFYIPAFIEAVQLLLHLGGYGTRSIDIDDVLLNMFGIWLGFLIGANRSPKKISKKLS